MITDSSRRHGRTAVEFGDDGQWLRHFLPAVTSLVTVHLVASSCVLVLVIPVMFLWTLLILFLEHIYVFIAKTPLLSRVRLATI